MATGTPTPEMIRNIVITKIRDVLVEVTSFIDDDLVKNANEFFGKNKLLINLKHLHRGTDYNDKFVLEDKFPDYSVDNNINRAMARQLIVFITEEYKKYGWDVASSDRNYCLTFTESGNFAGRLADGDDVVPRSELMDLEE